MKRFARSYRALSGLFVSALMSGSVFAHSGHGQDGSLFHGDIHVSWIVLGFVVVAYGVALIKRDKRT
jgi:hypothetical protein